MKTAELTGAALDWAVSKCEGVDVKHLYAWDYSRHKYSTDWSQGGPIIERTGMDLKNKFELGGRVCMAHMRVDGAKWVTGPTPLVAAMRCYVAFKLGDTVEIPTEFLTKGETA